jgi:hypothetical protein
VLDAGRVVEFDHPNKLITDATTRFHALCKAVSPGFPLFRTLLKESVLCPDWQARIQDPNASLQKGLSCRSCAEETQNKAFDFRKNGGEEPQLILGGPFPVLNVPSFYISVVQQCNDAK